MSIDIDKSSEILEHATPIASEVLYSFLGWVTGDHIKGSFIDWTTNVGVFNMEELVTVFLMENNLPNPRPDFWPRNIKYPTKETLEAYRDRRLQLKKMLDRAAGSIGITADGLMNLQDEYRRLWNFES